MYRIRFLIVALAFFIVADAHAQPNGQIQNSLVRITSTEVEPDYRAPWNSGTIQRGVGAGFVIDGQRIMTNAHVVSNSRYLTVEREGDPNKYPATVLFVAHDCDLALIQVAAPNFWKDMKPLTFGGIPSLESVVSAYGYPIGGERMSVTTGIVSRIDFNLYTHSAIDSHLAIQISAQINPGNSGGPVLQDGKVVGVAFQGYSGDIAQGVAYMIPTPVIRRFLKDIEDGHYDRYVDLGITYTKLQNPAQRHYLGLKDDDRGVLVDTVIDAGPCGTVLRQGDVLLSIDGHPIASDAFVEYEGERVQMPEVVERKFKGDTVKLDLLRKKQPMSLEIKSRLGLALPHAGPQLRHSSTLSSSMVDCSFSQCRSICSKLTGSVICASGTSSISSSASRFICKHPEVIILTNILLDPINTYLMPFRDLASWTKSTARKLARFRIWRGRSSNRRIDLS